MRRTCKSLIAGFILCCAMSCNKVSINTEDPLPVEVSIQLKPQWPSSSAGEPKLHIAAARVLNSVHYTYSYPEVRSDVWLHGDYFVLAFDRDDELYIVNGLEEFANDRSVSMRNISVSLPQYDENQQNDLIGPGIIDYNPSFTVIKSAGNLHKAVLQKNLEGYETGDIVLVPEKLSQNLTIRFRVETIEDVEITGINAFVSGVVKDVAPMSGIVSHDELFRAHLDVDRVSTNGNLITFEAKADILGIFSHESENASTGNGIMQLIIYAAPEGSSVSRAFYAGINLKKTMSGVDIMASTEHGEGFCISSGKVVLELVDVLRVSPGSIVGTSLGDGVDKWFDYENIDVDI